VEAAALEKLAGPQRPEIEFDTVKFRAQLARALAGEVTLRDWNTGTYDEPYRIIYDVVIVGAGLPGCAPRSTQAWHAPRGHDSSAARRAGSCSTPT